MAKSEIKWIRLGGMITKTDIRNSDGKYTLDNLRGLSIERKFIYSKANMDNVSLLPYKVVKPMDFCFVTVTSRNSDKITLAQNTSKEDYIVSSSYVTFRVCDENLLPTYLMLWFCRPEFNRYARFHSWGSARESFSYEDMCEVQIPIPFKDGKPDIEQQKIVVDAWQGLRKMKEDNEQLVEPLMQLCRSYMEDLKKRYIPTRIGQFIEQCNTRNYILQSKNVRGMSTQKEFRVPQSRVDFNNLGSYKVVQHNEFVFVPTTDTWRCLAIAYNKEDFPVVVSPIYCVFKIDENILLPDFLHLYFKRPEFDRYARFHSWGSARENFNFDDMCNVKIPIPDIKVQQAIIDIYRCAEKAKHIAEEADKLSREICPALMQHIIQTSKS